MIFYLYLFLGVVGDILGIYFAKKYIVEDTFTYLLLSFLMFGLTMMLWIEFLRNGQVGIMHTTWTILVIIGAMGIGWALFGEKLNWIQFSGLMVCILGLILLQWPTK